MFLIWISWISPLLKLGYIKPITEDDLYNPISAEESQFLTDQLEAEWKKELKNSKKPSLANAIIRIHVLKMIFLFFILSIEVNINIYYTFKLF